MLYEYVSGELGNIDAYVVTYCIQRAVAEGPNHSPGYLPQALAPCRTKL
jgi:hypothetical protein